jgi:arylsulfatase A
VLLPQSLPDYQVKKTRELPTFLRVAGVQAPEHLVLDGYDILDHWMGQSDSSPRQEMHWEFRGQWAVRSGDWKLLGGQRVSGLYDLSADIGEQHDLTDEHPEVVERLERQRASWRQQMEQAEPRRPFRDF